MPFIKPPNQVKYFIILLVLIIGFIWRLSAQTAHDEFITFEAKSEELSSVLNRLSEKSNLNITYNASDPSFNALVTYSAKSKRVDEILHEILSHTHLEYRHVGNHLVIIPSEIKAPESVYIPGHTSTGAEPKVQTNISETASATTAGRPDTIIRYLDNHIFLSDTIFIVDTVVITKTEVIRDTVFIRQESPRAPIRPVRRPGSLDIFRSETERDYGWAAGFFYSHALAGYEIISRIDNSPDIAKIKDAETTSFRNFSFGPEIHYKSGNLLLSAGITLSNFSNRFYYSEIFTSGGFTQTDTLDIFYTVIQNDTIWKYVTDTTWVPLNREEFFYDRINRMVMLGTHLTAAITVFRSNNFSIYTRAGIQAGIPIWLRGNIIINDPGFPAEKIDRKNFASFIFGYRGGLGARFILNNRTDFYTEAFYFRFINEPTANHPFERRLRGAGLQAGIVYHF